jgi:hypothetical protein
VGFAGLFGGKGRKLLNKRGKKVQYLCFFGRFIVFLQTEKIKKGIDYGKTN